MRLYRKVIPKIARDIIYTLNNQEKIEVEEGKTQEAELDLAAIMVEHLNSEDRVIKEAREMLQRRGLGSDRFAQAKISVAQARNIKLGEAGIEFIQEQLLEMLFASKNIAEVYAEDNDLRVIMKEITHKYTSISEEVDQAARQRLKNLKEGTPEWDIEYPRVLAQIKKQRGL